MLSAIHILLTYTCTFECDHCFLYCSPRSTGTFTIESCRKLIDQAAETSSITSVSFEGGEPLLFLPTLLSAVRYAKDKGLTTGLVTNAYTARSAEDAGLLLTMLVGAGLDSISISDDDLHFGNLETTPAQRLFSAAEERGFPAKILSVELPSDDSPTGGIMFRGRAADKLAEGLPRKPWTAFDECPPENPLDPARVHIDSSGNVHFCQGIVIGNVWKKPLPELIADWDLSTHPICGALANGGPAELAIRHQTCATGSYVDACHLCFEVRRRLLARYPEALVPAHVYGEVS